MEVIGYVEDRETSEFYPTPKALAERMLEGIEWDRVRTILEPSAGKGDLLKAVAKREKDHRSFNVDCIEIDPNLRAILARNFGTQAREDAERKLREFRDGFHEDYKTGRIYRPGGDNGTAFHMRPKEYLSDREEEEYRKREAELYDVASGFFRDGIRIVHDDFLTYTQFKEYDLIIMNPCFSDGARHLLKALEMQKHGGYIVCLLNANTVRNPHTQLQRDLVSILENYHADIEYIRDAFSDAERKTEVEVALIKVSVPKTDPEISIFEKLASEERYDEPYAENAAYMEVSDLIKAVTARYRMEVKAGIELIRTFERMKPYLDSSVTPEDGYGHLLLSLDRRDDMGERKDPATVNAYVRDVREKYWRGLLTNKSFMGRLTSKLQKEYMRKVTSFADYDFSEYNINTLVREMNAQIRSGIEEEISDMFDRLTQAHAYFPECTNNRYLFTGWKTNKAWKIGKKCILPCHGIFNMWDGKPDSYRAYDVLSDIERVLNFFDGNMTVPVSLEWQIRGHFSSGITKNIKCRFFNVTFYKKGTVHIVFTCPELIDRFNIYAAGNRGWLPPSYGKRTYDEMLEEERIVVDEFQGREGYERIMARPEYYLKSPVGAVQGLLETA